MSIGKKRKRRRKSRSINREFVSKKKVYRREFIDTLSNDERRAE
jgi:hypothetical protein